MFTFLLVVHAIIAASLVAVILMQRSEGGGLGMGGGPAGLMTARGAADFLTRATTILASLFIILSIVLAAIATFQRGGRTIDPSLARDSSALDRGIPAAPTPAADPLAAAVASGAASAPAGAAPAQAPAGPAAPAATERRDTTPPAPTAKRETPPAATTPAPAERRREIGAVRRDEPATPKPAAPAVPVVAPAAPPASEPSNGQ